MAAGERYTAIVDAYRAQRARFPGNPQRQGIARFARPDFGRPPTAIVLAVAQELRPDDILLDVGGGAGRLGLPLAAYCREVVNIEPSPAMRTEFEATAREAGITNVRLVPSDWESAPVVGSVALVAQVTYFIRDIIPFIQKLQTSTQRCILINLTTVPPPNRSGRAFELIHDEPYCGVPGLEELLPVLEELGIAPQVQVLTEPGGVYGFPIPDRSGALDLLLRSMVADQSDRARHILERHFDEVFLRTEAGYVLKQGEDSRQALITWETQESR